MSISPTPQEPAPDLRELSVELHLRDPRELFVVDDFDPFVPGAPTRSGVEQIKAAALEMKLPEKIKATLYLPEDKLEQETLPSIRAALTRYSAYRESEAQAAIAALKREAIGELRVGAVVLGVVVVLALLLAPVITAANPLLGAIGVLLSGALVIAMWVVVWAPIETFFIEPLPLVWERRFYQRLPQAEIDLRPESV